MRNCFSSWFFDENLYKFGENLVEHKKCGLESVGMIEKLWCEAFIEV